MRSKLRMTLAVVTVVLVGGVAVVAVTLNPPMDRGWMGVCAVFAIGMAIQAVSAEPRDLIPALLFAMVPVAGLVSAGSPWWLGPPFATLILLAGELSVLTWEDPVRMSEDGSLVTRLRDAGVLCVLGVGASVVVLGFATLSFLGGTFAVVVGSAALLGVGWVVFSGGGRRRESGRWPSSLPMDDSSSRPSPPLRR